MGIESLDLGIDGFTKTLNPSRPGSEELRFSLRSFSKHDSIVFVRKSNNLVEVIDPMLQNEYYPLVDKGLQMVFGVGDSRHLIMKAYLFDYRSAKKDHSEDDEIINPHIAADMWVMRGWGYFFSSVSNGAIVAASSYVQDRFDKDLFLTRRVTFSH